MLSLIENVICLMQFYFNQVDKTTNTNNTNNNSNSNSNNNIENRIFYLRNMFVLYFISVILIIYYMIKFTRNKSYCMKFCSLFVFNIFNIFLFRKGTTTLSMLSLGLLTPFITFNLTTSLGMILLSYYKEKAIYNL